MAFGVGGGGGGEIGWDLYRQLGLKATQSLHKCIWLLLLLLLFDIGVYGASGGVSVSLLVQVCVCSLCGVNFGLVKKSLNI